MVPGSSSYCAQPLISIADMHDGSMRNAARQQLPISAPFSIPALKPGTPFCGKRGVLRSGAANDVAEVAGDVRHVYRTQVYAITI